MLESATMDDARGDPPPGIRLTADLFQEGIRNGWVGVVGSSMEPLLPKGARVRLRPLAGRVPLGALVLFPQRDGLVVHRVVGRRGERLLTKGDRTLRCDPGLLAPGEILGVVTAAEHEGRRTDLESPVWGWAGRMVALHSRLWDLIASPLPSPLLDAAGGVPGRLLRKALRVGNGWCPWVASRILTGLQTAGPSRGG